MLNIFGYFEISLIISIVFRFSSMRSKGHLSKGSLRGERGVCLRATSRLARSVHDADRWMVERLCQGS